MVRVWKSVSSVWALTLALTGVSPARAGERVTADAAAVADEHYKRGVEAYKAKRYEEARLAFEKAYETLPAIEVLRNLGAAEVRSGKSARGARHLARWLRESPKASPDDVRVVKELLESAENELGRCQVTVNEDGAEISIDGEAIGKSPLTFGVHVDPGPRRVTARKEGRSVERTVTAVAGEETRVDLVLESSAKKAPVPTHLAPFRPTSVPSQIGAPSHAAQPDDTQTIWTLGLIGAGIGAAGALTAAGAAWAGSKEHSGTPAYHRASTVVYAGAIAGAAGDLILLTCLIVLDLRQPSGGAGQVWLAPRAAGLAYGGSF
jgi:hypothetical protein